MNKKIEHEIQNTIYEYLAYSGFKVWRNNVVRYKIGDRFVKAGEKGSADLMAVKNGKFYAFEIKKKGGRITESQELWLEDIRNHGGFAEVVRSLDEVIEKLKGI